MEKELREHLKKFAAAPVLFVGSGPLSSGGCGGIGPAGIVPGSVPPRSSRNGGYTSVTQCGVGSDSKRPPIHAEDQAVQGAGVATCEQHGDSGDEHENPTSPPAPQPASETSVLPVLSHSPPPTLTLRMR